MTLIIILLGLLVEHFVGVTEKARRLDWIINYQLWLENRLAMYPFWGGPVGLIITVALPLCLLLVVDYLLIKLFWPLELFFAFIVFIYSLGPRYLNPELDSYIEAIEAENNETADSIAMDIIGPTYDEHPGEQAVIENILLQANDRLFAVLFWFLILGPFGALLYRFVSVIRDRFADIHGGYADTARDLFNILNWPAARLLAVGNALAGNLVEAIDAWFENETGSLENNEVIIKASGLGALQYNPDYEPAEATTPEDNSYWIRATQGLLNRTLIIWLIVLGIMTIAGKLG